MKSADNCYSSMNYDYSPYTRSINDNNPPKFHRFESMNESPYHMPLHATNYETDSENPSYKEYSVYDQQYRENTPYATPNLSYPNRSMSNMTSPNMTNPNMATPNRNMPNMTSPNMTNPNMTTPNRNMPNITSPNMTNPNMTTPNRNMPNMTNPNMATPNRNMPNMTSPNMTNPNMTTPNRNMPNMTSPNMTTPNRNMPNMTAPNMTNPNMTAPNRTSPNMSTPNRNMPMTTPNMTSPNRNMPNMTNPNMTNPNPISAYGCENFNDLDKDLEYFKQMYPKETNSVLNFVIEECDKLEFEGSCMFDQCPDKTTLSNIVDRIYQNVNTLQSQQVENTVIPSQKEDISSSQKLKTQDIKEDSTDKLIATQFGRRDNDWLRRLIEVLLFNEMSHRRRRFRNRRRRY